MKKAFWDLVRTDVESGDFKQCVSLLAEIREQIESIGTIEKLSATHPLRVLIADTIDIDLIRQQVREDCKEFWILLIKKINFQISMQ